MTRETKLTKRYKERYARIVRQERIAKKIHSIVDPLVTALFLGSLVAFSYIAIKDSHHKNVVHAMAPEVESVAKPKSKTVKQEIREVFDKDSEIMLKVAWCESRFDPKIRNPLKGSSATGVFQILRDTWKGYSTLDHEIWAYDQTANILVAKKLFDKRGLNPWEASKGCWANPTMKDGKPWSTVTKGE